MDVPATDTYPGGRRMVTRGWWECDSGCGAKFWPIFGCALSHGHAAAEAADLCNANTYKRKKMDNVELHLAKQQARLLYAAEQVAAGLATMLRYAHHSHLPVDEGQAQFARGLVDIVAILTEEVPR